ncbi:MAG: histidine kinase [Bacteroidales bacterium]
MKRISITEKLIFYFVCLGLVVIIIIGSYTYYFAKKALLNRTFDQLISLRLEKKNRIEQFFIDRNRDLSIISKSEECRKIINLLNSESLNSNSLNKEPSNSNLSRFISSYGYYHKLYIINNKNSSFTINSPESELCNYSDIKTTANQNLISFCNEIKKSNKTIIQDLSKSNLLIYIGSPIYDQYNIFSGFVILEIPITAINKIMFGYSEKNGLGKSGETYLVGNDFLMRSNSRFKENAVSTIRVTSKSVANAFKGINGCDIVNDYRNISCLSSYSKVNIDGLNWVILAEINEAEAMIPVDAIRNSILIISIIIAGIVFIFAYFISKKITLPIKKLQKASKEIGTGNYDVNVEISSMDEIGLLTEAFNDMTSQLKKQSNELEEGKAKRLSSLIDGQEMERQRLSRDMHDSLGQSLLAVKIKLEHAKNSNFEKSRQLIIETQELLSNTIQEIKNISNDLMPPVLEAFGLEQGLRTLCKNTATNTGIPIEFISKNIPATMDARMQIYLYRISQEAINNISKHSAASEVIFSISFSSESVLMNIADNGKGFDIENIDAKSNGILNIKERVKLLKGECDFFSSIENGTKIIIKIPKIKYD